MATSAAPAAATVDEGVLDPSQQNVLTKVLSQVVQERQAQLDRLRKELHARVNWQRKSTQTAAADKLTLLHQTCLSLVSKNFQLEGACETARSTRSSPRNIVVNQHLFPLIPSAVGGKSAETSADPTPCVAADVGCSTSSWSRSVICGRMRRA